MRRLTIGWLVCLLTLVLGAAPATAQVAPEIFAPNNDGTSNANLYRLFASDFEQLKTAIAACGVDKTSYDADGALVSAQASPNMTVHVDDGDLRCAGAIVDVDADDLTIGASNPTQTRIDLIVADGTNGALSVIAGTAAANPVSPDLPAGDVLLARVVVTPGITAITDALIVDKRLPVTASGLGGGGSGLPGIFLLSDYGAVGDGSTDDTDEINAAFAAASAEPGSTVVAGCDKTYWFDDTLILGSTVAGTDSFVNLLGCGPNSTRFEWHGSTSGVAIRVARVKFSRFEGFSLLNDVAVGTTQGLVLGGNTATYGGTQSLGNGLHNVLLQGFDIGIAFGGFNGAASENHMERATFYGNDTGWTNTDGNSLNNTATLAGCSENGVCGAGGSAGLLVVGGSGSLQTVSDFTCVASHAACTVTGWRSEVGERFFVADGSAQAITLIGNESSSMNDDIAVELKGSGSSATLTGNRFQDAVSLGGYYNASLSMTNNLVVTSTAYPFEVQSLSDLTANNVSLTLRGNYDFVNSTTRTMLDDIDGFLHQTWTGPCCPGTFASRVDITLRLNRDEGFTGTPFRPAQTLFNIQSIAQGDAVVGKNLSYHVNFGSSGTAQVDFQRNVTVDAPANPFTAVGVTAGDLTIGDIGRRITIAGGADYAAYIGTITGRASSTSFTLQALHNYYGECGACSTVTAVVGEDEPDANYLIEFACNANENFWWSSKATTGFQMNSSNASSTAECDVLIHR